MKNWKQNLHHLLNNDDDCRDGVFGSNIDCSEKDIKRYLNKLEKMGVTDITFPSYENVTFVLPTSPDKVKDILLFIITNKNYGLPLPVSFNFNKKNNKLELNWDYENENEYGYKR